MQLPIKITRGHRWVSKGYAEIYTHGKIKWNTTIFKNSDPEDKCVRCSAEEDTSGVKFQVWVHKSIIEFIKFFDVRRVWEKVWWEIIGKRIDEEKEKAYWAGVKHGINIAGELYGLTPEEVEALQN